GDLTVAVITARGPPLAVGRPSRVQRAATRLRAGLQRAASGLPGDARALLPGLVDGDVSAVRPALTNDFRATGLTHLTAVSGANIAIVVGAVLLLARSLTLGPRTCAVLGAVAMIGFVILARPQPSVLRAAVMGGFALVALATGRARATVPALSATVLILVFAVPELAGSPGFAMSVCATGALLVVAPRLAGALTARRVPRPLALAMAVPAAAHLASAPLIAAISGQVSLVAIPANMLAEPAVAPATVLGVLAAVVSVGSPALARLLAQLAGWPTRWIVAVGVHGAAVPDGVVGWPSGAVGALLLAAVIAAGAVVLSRSGAVRRAALAGCVGAAAAVVPIRIFAGGWPPPGWFFVACDVGQGDGLVLRAGPGEAVVVDTGPDPAVMDGCLRRLGISRVPVLVITHVDADHVGGIAGVFDHRVVGTVLTGPLHIPATGWSLLTATAAAHHRPVHRPAAGTTWRSGDVQCTVLGPVTPAGGPTADNDSALVLRARVAGRTVLLTADTEVAAQRELLLRGVDLRADVLKVPHHGSDHSDPAFLAATGAPLAVLSVGAQNNYGQPAPPILSLLARLGMRIERTDRVGDIAVGVRSGRLVVVTRS
ncbi:MAG: ComEC/Rec2 family competence protein, partial [Mycobacteriales bacterium]